MENGEKQLLNNNENKPVWKKAVYITLNVLFYIFIAFLLIFAIANIASKKNNNIPSIFGYGFLNVASDSMDGNKEDSLKVGDLIIVKLANEKRIEAIEVEKSIITYYDDELKMLVTHRVVDIKQNDQGETVYYTQGDRVEVVTPGEDYKNDGNYYALVELHSANDILAIYSGKISGAGKVLAFLQTKVGFGLCIVLPAALLLIFEAYLLIKNLFAVNREKLAAELEAKGGNQNTFDIEEEKRKIREELLAEMKKEEEAKAKENENKEE